MPADGIRPELCTCDNRAVKDNFKTILLFAPYYIPTIASFLSLQCFHPTNEVDVRKEGSRLFLFWFFQD